MGTLNHVTSPPNNFADRNTGLSRRKKWQREQKENCSDSFHLPNPVYFTPNFCLSQDMDAALPPLTASTLYLVATPIGNLEDITLRALRVLRECDVVAAEDTRRSGQLLKHFGIARPLLSYFQFNEARCSEEIIERLRRGGRAACAPVPSSIARRGEIFQEPRHNPPSAMFFRPGPRCAQR